MIIRTYPALLPMALALALTLSAASTHSHWPARVVDNEASDRPIRFPDVAEYQTLVVDLHSHSVFSDGHVWPKIRVEEALRDGLDGFAVTEHLEYQPHRADIPHLDRNRSFIEAESAAKDTNLIVIPGSEITRELPAGHINAIFIRDANALLQVAEPPEDPSDSGAYYRAAGAWPPEQAVAAANAQGAFVFINHPDWTRQRSTGLAELTPLQRRLIAQKLIHGIEIANGDGYSAEAFDIALDRQLTLLGVSDIHDLIDWDYPPATGAHRPVTLVFAEQRSAAGIQAALQARRTVVWFKNELFGREAQLRPLVSAALVLKDAQYEPDTETVKVTLENRSDARFELHNRASFSFRDSDGRLTVDPHASASFTAKPGRRLDRLQLSFVVENALTAPGKPLSVTFDADLSAAVQDPEDRAAAR